MSLWIERARKYVYRVVWWFLACLSAPCEVVDLHHRRVEDGVDEYVRVCTGPAYIEPEFGYVITDGGRLIEDSFSSNFHHVQRPWRVGLPSPFRFIAARMLGWRARKYESVVSLRHPWEWNYYHFFLDVLGKLRLADSVVGNDVPIAMGRYVNQLAFAAEVLSTGDMSRREWVIQEGFFVRADKLFYIRTRDSLKTRTDYLLDRMLVPRALRWHSEARIFLSRSQRAPRHVVNMPDILPLLNRYGFEVVDTAGMAVERQIALFSRVRFLVAVHGAGLTNMIFRRDARLVVVELYPRSFHPTYFMNMCREYGYEYYELPCEPAGHAIPKHDNCLVDPVSLESVITQLLEKFPDVTRGVGA